jgi:uncharacterized membrane protein YdjX (TVP38/TMEM64 family)
MPKKTPSPTASPWKAVALVIALCVGFALLYRQIDIDAVHAYAGRLNGGIAFALLVVLPLVGFPVSVLHVVAGMRFGTGMGMTLVALSIVLQLLASYGLVYLFQDKFARRLKNVRQRIPRGAHGATCLFTMLLPGVPYFAKNYVLPLLGIPLSTYLAICVPVHILRSAVAVMFGDKSDDLTPGRIAALVVYLIVMLVTSWWLLKRLRAQMEPAATGKSVKMQPA